MDLVSIIKNFKEWKRLYDRIYPLYLYKLNIIEEPISLSVNSLDFYIRPSRGDRGVLEEYYKEDEYANFDFEQFDVILDIGAHIGVVALDTAEKLDKIYSVEANPGTFHILEKNIEANSKSNIKAFNLAISGEGDDLTLNINENSLNDSLERKNSEKGDSTKIKSSTLTNFIEEHVEEDLKHNSTLLKMDIEGSEFGIMENLDPSDLRLFDAILLEYHTWSGDPQEVLEILKKSGFKPSLDKTDHETGIIRAKKK